MATGTIAFIDRVGRGTIIPDSRGERIEFTVADAVGLAAGDQVWFLARMTHRGVVAHEVKLHDAQR